MTERSRPSMLFVSLPRALGGSNRSLVTLLQALDGSVNRVLASPGGGPFEKFANSRDAFDEWIPLFRKGPFGRFRRVIDSIHIAAWATRNRGRLHGIHANATTGLIAASLAGVLTRVQVTVWVHDPVSTSWGRRLGPWIRRLVPSLRVAAVSGTARSVAVEMGLCSPEDVVIVPNPIDPADVVFREATSREGVTIAVLGGTSFRKGFDLLPDVVAGVDDLDVAWLLYVNPDVKPDNSATWDQLAKYREAVVRVPGRTADVREAYAASDIVFCPSREESFCRVAAEAMMNGLPVVGSSIQPLEYLLGDGAGVLFPPEDTEAASEAIRRMVENPEQRESAGEIGRRRSQAFLPSDVASTMLDLYGLDSDARG